MNFGYEEIDVSDFDLVLRLVEGEDDIYERRGGGKKGEFEISGRFGDILRGIMVNSSYLTG